MSIITDNSIRTDRAALERELVAAGATVRGTSCTCPSPGHDDANASAGIYAGDAGVWRCKCHGCGWSGDIFDVQSLVEGRPVSEVLKDARGDARSTRATTPVVKPKRTATLHPTPERAAEAALWSIGQRHGEGWTLTDTWTYRDPEGVEYARVVRFDGPDKKTYRPITREGDGWRIGDPEQWHPYRVDELPAEGEVWIVEGEKSADALWSVGIPATTSAHGAKSPSKTDWSALAGRDVALWPDLNEVGSEYAEVVAGLLVALEPPALVRIIDAPEGLPPGGDAFDYIEDRDAHDAAAIVEGIRVLAENAEPWKPVTPAVKHESTTPRPERRLSRVALTRRLSDVQPERLAWLWPGRLALGKLAIIAGNGGLGKSTVTMDIASRVTTGIGWPDQPGERFAPGGVVLLSAEDDAADTIRPRMDAAGADVSRVTLLDGVSIFESKDGPATESHIDLATDLPALEQAIVDTPDCKLVVIDPVTAYMGKADDHRNAEVRGLLAPLSRLAAKHGVALLCVTHLNKGQGEAIHRIVGSIAFGAAARIALAVTKDRDDPSRRLMMNVKSNIAPEHTGLAFRVEPCIANPEAGVVVWDDEPVEVNADQAMNSTGDDGDANPTALGEATDWLAEVLADGPRHAGEVKQQAKADGIAPRTLDRAKAKLGVIAAPDGLRGPWSWRLPNGPSESQSAPTDSECATPTGLAHCGEDGALWAENPDAHSPHESSNRK